MNTLERAVLDFWIPASIMDADFSFYRAAPGELQTDGILVDFDFVLASDLDVQRRARVLRQATAWRETL